MKKMNMVVSAVLLLLVSTSSWARSLPQICTDISVCPSVQGPRGPQGSTGPRGQPGPVGPQGLQGPAGSSSNDVYFEVNDHQMQCRNYASGSAECSYAPLPTRQVFPVCHPNDVELTAAPQQLAWRVTPNAPVMPVQVTSARLGSNTNTTMTTETIRIMLVCAATSTKLP